MGIRFPTVKALKLALASKPLHKFAQDLGVTVKTPEGKINKGWIGQTLDRLIQTPAVNSQLPDGADFELKSVHGVIRAETGNWEPKETMAITMLSPENIIHESFETSAVWHKLSRLILVGHVYEDDSREVAKVVRVCPVDVSDPELIFEIKKYWELIHNTVISGKISSYSSKGTSKGFLQLRTKGAGGNRGRSVCPKTGVAFNSRAFYATKPFLRYVFGVIEG